MTEHGTRSLSAADTLVLTPEDVVTVVSGTALVFAVDSDGRRISLASLAPGDCLVGSLPGPDGETMLVTGLPGTVVDVGALADADAEHTVTPWLRRLSAAVAAGRWPRRVIDARDLEGPLAPGECLVGAEDENGIAWVAVTSGAATLCGIRGVTIGPLDGAVPMGPAAWLEAGLRCRVTVARAPASHQEWSRAIGTLGRLAVLATIRRRELADRDTVERLAARELGSSAATRAAVDLMVAAIGGEPPVILAKDPLTTSELGAAAIVARAAALTLTDESLQRATADADAGRNPLEALGDALGARPRPVALDEDWLRREGRPVVAWVRGTAANPRRPVAIIRQRRWTLVDPVTGDRSTVDATVAATLEPEAVEFQPVLPSAPTTVRRLVMDALRGSSRDVAWIAAMTVGLAILSFVMPFLMGQLAVLFADMAPWSAYAALFATLLLSVVAMTLLSAVRALALLRVRSRSVSTAAGATWDRIIRQPAEWHAKRTLGDRIAQAQSVTGASATVPDDTIARILDIVVILGTLAAVATTGASMLLTATTLVVILIALMALLLRRSSRFAAERIDAAAQANGRLLETLKAVNRLRVAGAESRAFLRWAQLQSRFARIDLHLRRTTMIQGVVIGIWPIVTFIALVLVTSITGLGFPAFLTAQVAMATAIGVIAVATLGANTVLIARRGLQKATPLLESAPEGGGSGDSPGMLSGRVELRDVVFGYALSPVPVLDHVSLRVEPGEHVAIVGPSGCGKTTLIRVLLGLEEPSSGVIALDDRDLASLDRPAVRRQIGSVLQSSQLLPGTLRENIDMGRGLTAPEMWQALEAAEMADDVRAMPMGLDTPVTDGTGTISGGQRQRILIARALAGSPRILVLDEATSALDNITQSAVVQSLETLKITRIVIAHRLSTIRHADRIVVMDGGLVVDEGTYDDLIERCAAFRALAERQTV